MYNDLISDKHVVFISPTFPTTAPQTSLSILDLPMTGIFNILKLPVTQIPLGKNFKGLPLGCQIIGNNAKID